MPWTVQIARDDRRLLLVRVPDPDAKDSLFSPTEARALAAELVRAADEAEAATLTCEVVDPGDCKPGEFYIVINAYGASTFPFILSTAHYDNARAAGLRCRPCILGFSVYKGKPGYGTLGLDFADWLASPLHRNMVIRRDYDRVAAHKRNR